MATKKKTAAPETDKKLPEGATKLAPAEPPPEAQLFIGQSAAGTNINLHTLDQVTNSLERLVPNVLKLEAAAERAVITDEAGFNKGSTFISSCDGQWNQIEALRKAVKGPLDDYVKLVQATFMPYLNRIEAAKTKVNGLMKVFYRAEEARKKAEADALRKAQEEKAQEIAAQAEKAGNTEVAEAVLQAALSAPAPKAQVDLGKQVNALGGRTQARKTWKGEVVDKEALLRAILEGKVPWVVVEFKAGEINTVARQIQAEGTIHGIKVTHEVDLSQRRS